MNNTLPYQEAPVPVLCRTLASIVVESSNVMVARPSVLTSYQSGGSPGAAVKSAVICWDD